MIAAVLNIAVEDDSIFSIHVVKHRGFDSGMSKSPLLGALRNVNTPLILHNELY